MTEKTKLENIATPITPTNKNTLVQNEKNDLAPVSGEVSDDSDVTNSDQFEGNTENGNKTKNRNETRYGEKLY